MYVTNHSLSFHISVFVIKLINRAHNKNTTFFLRLVSWGEFSRILSKETQPANMLNENIVFPTRWPNSFRLHGSVNSFVYFALLVRFVRGYKQRKREQNGCPRRFAENVVGCHKSRLRLFREINCGGVLRPFPVRQGRSPAQTKSIWTRGNNSSTIQ